jgi:hypothetical protein
MAVPANVTAVTGDPPSLLDGRKRLWWSQDDMETLDRVLKEFRNADKQAIYVKLEGPRGKAYLHGDVSPPPELERLVCNILQDFSAALNYLAYQLAVLDTGTNPPPRANTVEFPIFSDLGLFDKHHRLQDLTPEHLAKIRAVQPIGGGKQSLWILHELSRVNRHRLLHPTDVFTGPDENFNVIVEGGTLKTMEIVYRGPFKHGREVLRFEIAGNGWIQVVPVVPLIVGIDHELTRDRQALGVLSDIGHTIVDIYNMFTEKFPAS